MRILRVVALASRTGKYGGPFVTAAGQVALLREEGHDVRLVAGAFPGDDPELPRNLKTFPVRHIAGLRSFVDVAGLQMIPDLWRHVRDSDLVHVSMAREPVPVVASVFAVVTGAPLVLQPHGMLTTAHHGWGQRILDSLLIRPLMTRASRIIALTDKERLEMEDWSHAIAGHIDVVGNPPPADSSSNSAHSGPNSKTFADALFAARLHPRKRVLDFAGAAEISVRNGWDDRYVVLGPDEGDLAALTEIAGRTHSLNYAGATDNAGVLSRLRESRVFVLSSANEPWGNVLVAALSYGKPVVVTESSALAGVVESYGAGRVVPDSDAKAIAEAVHDVLTPDRYCEFSARARALAEAKLSMGKVRTALLQTYSKAEFTVGAPRWTSWLNRSRERRPLVR